MLNTTEQNLICYNILARNRVSTVTVRQDIGIKWTKTITRLESLLKHKRETTKLNETPSYESGYSKLFKFQSGKMLS